MYTHIVCGCINVIISAQLFSFLPPWWGCTVPFLPSTNYWNKHLCGFKKCWFYWLFQGVYSPELLKENICIPWFILLIINYQMKLLQFFKLISNSVALTGVAQWIEHWPANQRVISRIPSQGTCLGCGATFYCCSGQLELSNNKKRNSIRNGKA